MAVFWLLGLPRDTKIEDHGDLLIALWEDTVMLNLHRMIWGIFILLIATSGTTLAQTQTNISGIWQTRGYGYVFDINQDHFTAYQVTPISCVALMQTDSVIYTSDRITAQDVALLFESFDFDLWLEDDLLLFDDAGTNLKVADRINALPDVCVNGVGETNDPEANFEALWHTFNMHYPFFDLYGVDWDAVYADYRPQVTMETTPDELFIMFAEMLMPLRDGHIFLFSVTASFSPVELPAWLGDDPEAAIDAYLTMIATDYVPEFELAANATIAYGWLRENVGYLNLLGMADFIDATITDDQAALTAAMDALMLEFADAETLVIDLRFNPGGDDQAALTVAGYFTEQPVLAYRKSARVGDGFGTETMVYVEPAASSFGGDVILLTSGYTASAAEILTLALRDLPRVTVIGEPTNGILSDMLQTRLPNGWFVGLPNERYLSMDRVHYEGDGIPPHVLVPMSADDTSIGTDPVLDYALSLGG